MTASCAGKGPFPLELLAAQLLAADATAVALREQLRAIMTTGEVPRVNVPGRGFVSLVHGGTTTPTDVKACEERLRELGEAVPVKVVTRSASVRVTHKSS